MRLGSLFAGIGGFDLAASRCGIEIGWQVEIDEWCREVLAKHWPDVPKYGDIREVEELPYVDIIAGGFPCQPVSLAGKGLAEDDERWLWPEFERIIRMVRPRYVVVENVPGLLGRGMGNVLGGLSACGYDAEWTLLPAAAFGAPHIRQRVWIVAYPNSQSDTPERGQCAPAEEEGSRWRAQRGRGTGDAEREIAVRATGQAPRILAYPESSGFDRRRCSESGSQAESQGCGEGIKWSWETEPDICRVADGIPRRVDRLRGLGNAIVPQVAEWIFQQIVKRERLSI